MPLIELPYKFTPRLYQQELMKAIVTQKYKHIYSIMHRRAGKSLTAINILTMLAIQKPALYFYLMPQTNQCRKVMWLGRGSDGVLFLERVHPSLRAKINNSEMSIQLINGSIIQFVGSNNFDALIGSNPYAIFYDEYALQTPLAYELLAPILVENGGIEVIFGTPRGHNHAFDLYNVAINNPDWFVQRLTIEDTFREDGATPIITLDQLEQERRNGKSEETIAQEYYCSFESGNLGAYYTRELAQAEYEQRICDFQLNVNLPVHTSWDIGVGDNTSICLFQQDGQYIKYVGYIEGNNKGFPEYVEELENLRYSLGLKRWGYHFAPHDIRVREWANSARSRLSVAAELGWHFLVVPQVSVGDRIEAGRAMLRECIFHKTNCRHLLRCLREAMREYDELNKTFKDKPLHNWALHGFDAYTYGAVAWRENFANPEMNIVRKYETSF